LIAAFCAALRTSTNNSRMFPGQGRNMHNSTSDAWIDAELLVRFTAASTSHGISSIRFRNGGMCTHGLAIR